MLPGDLAELPPLLQPNPEGIARAADLLRAGEIVALPTETVYGLAANALDEKAVRYIFSVKGRPLRDPLIIHGLDEDYFHDLAEFTPAARELAATCWPGPLTLVLRKKDRVSSLITAGRDTVAVRAPAHPVMRSVLAKCRLPLAAPSANPFGYLSPTRAEHVRESFGGKVPWILDGGPCTVGVESTIVDVSNATAPPRILRPGPITCEALERILGQRVESVAHTSKIESSEGLLAPGMLTRHYSPLTSFNLLPAGVCPESPVVGRRVAWVRFNPLEVEEPPPKGVEIFWLSKTGDLAEAARGLYELLRRLDPEGYEKIWCELAPQNGWGLALNDRLRRAAGRG
ncbi:MAG TPA: L-threonylcarbamoyladenylate synthase [Opitutales bacterium]|nr:L-threonylcarbamoyladenylate synthase [Opitutales bacterium]